MKYPEDFINKIIQGDCLEVMKELPDDLIVVTDPPYGISLDSSWLTSLHVKQGKPANKCDDKIIDDDKPFDLTPLLRFSQRVIFGFPYILDPHATGWLVWDKQPGVEGERTIGNPVEMASATTWRGFKIFRNMWAGYYRAMGEKRQKHPTQKPIRVMRAIIEWSSKPGDIILDPFMGSGTTVVAAAELNRHYIGIELNPDYVKIAEERLSHIQQKIF